MARVKNSKVQLLVKKRGSPFRALVCWATEILKFLCKKKKKAVFQMRAREGGGGTNVWPGRPFLYTGKKSSRSRGG